MPKAFVWLSADAARLVRVRQLDAELEAERRAAPRLVAQLDLGREAEVARVVRRVCARRMSSGIGARAARVDAQEVLRDAFDRELDVGREADVDADDADARQVARQPRDGELRVLHEIDPGLDAERVPGGSTSTSSVRSGRCCARARRRRSMSAKPERSRTRASHVRRDFMLAGLVPGESLRRACEL